MTYPRVILDRDRRQPVATFFCSAALALALVACGGSGESGGPAATSGAPATTGEVAPAPEAVRTVRAVELAAGLAQPWGLDFLPDGRILVTERAGTMRLLAADGSSRSPPLGGVPAVAFAGDSQGGLLDVVVGPTFEQDRRVFFTFSEAAPGGNSRAAVASATLQSDTQPALSQVTVIARQTPAVAGGAHYGARIAISPRGDLFVGFGERNQPAQAADLGTTLGKSIRIRQDGSIPEDNPFFGRSDARPEIWSYGHRNPQGIAIDPGTGQPWMVEHGPLGGDELNRLAAGRDHGWPRITWGRDYASGRPLGQGTTDPAVEPAAHVWLPTSIAPSSLLFYTGDAIAGWQGSVLVGALAGKALVRLTLAGGRVTGEERLLESLGERIRALRQGRDGLVYLLTDSGRLLRLQPG